MKKYLAELVGTFVLTFLGCGAAVAVGCGADTASIVGTAFAFGLAVVAMAYTIGGISGCHINPAISLGCFLSGRMTAKDCGMYIIFQVIGAILAAAVLAGIVGGGHYGDFQVVCEPGGELLCIPLPQVFGYGHENIIPVPCRTGGGRQAAQHRQGRHNYLDKVLHGRVFCCKYRATFLFLR